MYLDDDNNPVKVQVVDKVPANNQRVRADQVILVIIVVMVILGQLGVD